MPRTRLISIMPLLLIVATGACMAQPTPPTAATAQNQTLRVATGQTAPFVLDENGVLTGFSIDLWQEIAGRLKREFVWVKLPSNYVRAYNGQNSRWYRAAVLQRAGRIVAAGMTKEVTFDPVVGSINHRIDDAYRAKYESNPYLTPMISTPARSATIKIMPRETNGP